METEPMPMNDKRRERLRTCAQEVHEYEIQRDHKLARNDVSKTWPPSHRFKITSGNPSSLKETSGKNDQAPASNRQPGYRRGDS